MLLNIRKTYLCFKYYKFYLENLKTFTLNDIYRYKSTMSSKEWPLVAVCQLTSTADKEKNFNTCKSLIETAKFRGAKMVFLPEGFDYIGENRKQIGEFAEPLSGALMTKYREIAKTEKVWLSLGGFHEKGPENEKRVYVAHVIIDDNGEFASIYRKLHTFDVDTASVRLKESDFVIPGSNVIPPVKTPIGNIGLGICYDLRFPEFSLSLVKAGADILTYPSAFTQVTGLAHWEPLLRSRAIESQCYVIAAAQSGQHNPKRASYGHAMIIDPWGTVAACCSDLTGIAMAEINHGFIEKVRKGMPVWLHRRSELYGELKSPESNIVGISEEDNYEFGTIKLHHSQLFFRTRLSMAFVNKKPVIPGHVLLTPVRCVKKLHELSPAEISDLFMCVQKVQKAIETEHNASSSTIAIQDGPDAGQSISHIHVHILPRKPGDFKRVDDIYSKLETHDKIEGQKWRSEEDMAEEAIKLRKYFY